MVKISLTNNQTAFEYALYMIASSYFDKPVCMSKVMEIRLLLQYKEQKLDKQYQFEDICIRYMDELEKKLPEWFFKKDTKVFLVPRKDFVKVVFKTRNYVLELWGIYRGGKTEINSKLWVKEKKQAA